MTPRRARTAVRRGRGRPALWAALALALALPLAGCGPKAATRNTGRVELVQLGWAPNQVQNKIGKPLRVIEGRDLDLGREEWVYPKGSVIFRRMEVVDIRERAPGEPLPQARRSELDYPRDLFAEEDSYYRRREEAERKQTARYDGFRRSLQPGRTREELENANDWRRDDRRAREEAALRDDGHGGYDAYEYGRYY